MKKILTHLFAVLLLLFVTTSAWAQFENGKVYRIVCSGTNSVSLGASALTDVAAVSTSETEKTQQWYVTVNGSNYTFRNLANGRYLLGNNSTSNAWGLTETSNDFTVTAVNGNYAIRGASHANGYGYMHKDGSNNIVSWESGAANSQWTPIEVSYTAAELKTVWDEVEALVVPSSTVSGYQEKLDAIFSDKACTVLKSEYTSANMSNANLENDENYSALPQVLKDMVKKVRGGDWSEKTVAPADRPNGNNNTNHSLWTVADTWDNDYAKKFRVQMYEPYSVEGEITSYLRINRHSNMDNPTGIYANAGEPMYIMVEGTIEDGAELWVAHQVGHGATNYYNDATYTQLHEGLNVVPYFFDGSQLWINYLVHTYNANEKTIEEKFPHKLSEYKPLKIHIEGGKINGFFNAMGDYRATTDAENLWGDVDNDADWNYYKARAALSGDFALLGHRQTLLFDFGTWNSTNGYFGVANEGGGIEKALAWHLENITVPSTPNCYAGSGNALGDYSDTYYPGMQLSATTGKINIMLEAWDRIQYSEHASLGLLSVANIEKMNALYPRWTANGEAAEIYNYGSATVNGETKTYKDFCQGIDYSDYYNHHGAAVGSGSGYMSGGSRVCNYHYNTMSSIIGLIAAEAGPTWGPAHEIGHQHQTIFNLNGQTEVTNNFHSNVAVWYMGMGTSRVNGSEGSLASVLEAYNTDNNDLYTNNIWAITHLYYRLWLYYHLAGNNTQFWPRLFELLRQVPIVNGGQISGETSLLRFYQHACDAAGEDLTEFFRAHGFFEIMTDRLVGDYSNGTYNVTEEQIKTAISAVKAKGYPNNYAIILINDGTEETTVKHDGKTPRALWDNNPSAEYGSVTAFIDGETSVTDAYEAVVSADGTVTMSGGEGGVGFLIFNEDGEIVSFSNKASFEISDEAAYLLATGKAELVALDSENNKTEANVDLTAVQSSLIVSLVADVENLLKYVDDTYTKVGYFKASSVVDLQSALETAKATIETGTGLAAAYELLYTEYQNVLNNEDAKVAIISGAKYAIKSKSGNDYMDVDGSGNVKTTASSTFPTDDSDLWIIEIASKDTYKIKNASTGKYLQEVSDANSVNFTVGDNAVNYGITNVDYVYHAFSTKKCPGRYMDRFSATQVATWGELSDNNKWFITLVDDDLAEKSLATAELQALVAKAETLMNEVATVSLKGELQLQADNANSAFFITSNATETGHEPKYLLDNNVSTFFHTVWWGTSPGADHYLQIDLGEEYPVDEFTFKYTNLPTTTNNVDAAEAITVQVANALDNFTTIATLTTSDSNPLPTAKEGTYTSATMGTKGNTYRYIRLIVTDATGGKLGNYYYFGMSEFSLERLNSYSKVKDAYTGHITQNVVETVADKLVDAKTVIANGGDIAAAKDALQEAYDALLLEYNDVANAKKEELQELIDATNELIAQVGEATVIAGGPVNLHGKLYAERPYTVGGENHSDYSSVENDYNLLDGDKGTFFHSDYNASTMVSPPYIRVDMGEGRSITKFTFNYTTRGATGCAPKTIEVYGGNAVAAVTKGTIQTSADLNAITTPTKIIIQSFSGTNNRFLGGATNVSDINQAVLVWEPVTEGTPGTYYLRTTDAENGYIQASTGSNETITLGTKANAQVFVTTAPTTSGTTNATKFDSETLYNGVDGQVVDAGNFVRFVQYGKSTWLNVNNANEGYLPRLGNSGRGGWTVHNVYTVVETTVPEFETTPLATFNSDDTTNPLPLAASTDWVSSTGIGNGNSYRYLKFSVTNSEGVKGSKYYFVMSEFGLTVSPVREVSVYDEFSAFISEDLLVDTRRTVNDSETLCGYADKYTITVEQLKAQLEILQAAYDALNLAKNQKELPVILTTDVNNPVLYKIRINRGSTKLLQYDTETAMVAVADEDLGNEYQAWYFMQGTDGNGYDDVLIYPYWGTDAANTTLRLGSNSITDGNSKVSAVDGTDDTYKQNWYITFTEGTTAEGWLNIQPEGKATYFSNHGGAAEKMGFLNNAGDDGSEFQFVLDETDYSLSDAYYALLKQYNAYGDVEAGTAIGTYTQASVDAFNAKRTEVAALLEAKNSTDDEYNTAREQLVAAYEALVVNMPDPAKYYVLRCNHEDRYIYVNADNKLQWATSSYDKAQSRAVWQFEEIDASNGTCKMKSLHTQSYMQTVSSGNQVVFGTEGAIVTITPSGSVDGAVIFEAGNNNVGLHAHGSENRVIGYGNGAAANHYFFEEVEVVTGIKHDVTMNTKFSSVTLGYNATVPAGVEAYNAVGLEGGYVTLVKVAGEGEVIPANTPVILYRTDGESEAKTFTFTYTDETAEKPASTLLGGSLYTKYVQCDDSDYYKLMIKNGEAKMYLMYKEFNAQGVSQGATHAGGHIKCSANKIYMRVPGGNEAAVYSMRFIGSGVTGIDGVNAEDAEGKTIYDLQGRKLTEITEPGFYIVDGKKVYVK